MRALELRVPPPVVASLLMAGMWSLAHWWPVWRFQLPAQTPLGVAVAVMGVGVTALGALEFRRFKTTVNPLRPEKASSVVSTGIFRVTRNPMYVGLLLVLTGVFVWAGAVSAAVALPAFVLYINRFQIQPEERALLAKFGDEYARYQAQVRRWL